jgi:hypothetical protein
MQDEFSKKDSIPHEIHYLKSEPSESSFASCLRNLSEKENNSKLWLERTLIQSRVGKLIDQFRGGLACASSVLYVILSYLDSYYQ